MKFLNFFQLVWVIFAFLDPDSEYVSGSTELNTDPDPKPWLSAPQGWGVSVLVDILSSVCEPSRAWSVNARLL
jgi:hypothetical protein